MSERTIYRDVADLQFQGVPIEGEAGVGYRLGAGFDLPPMMFTQDEAKALVASVRMAQVWLDPVLAQGAQDALGEILSVLPVDARVAAEALAVYAPQGGLPESAQRTLQTLREAVQERRKVFINYRDLAEKAERTHLEAAGLLLLGQGLDAGGLVRTAQRFPHLQGRSRHLCAQPGRSLSRWPGRTLADMARLNEARAREQGWAA